MLWDIEFEMYIIEMCIIEMYIIPHNMNIVLMLKRVMNVRIVVQIYVYCI